MGRAWSPITDWELLAEATRALSARLVLDSAASQASQALRDLLFKVASLLPVLTSAGVSAGVSTVVAATEEVFMLCSEVYWTQFDAINGVHWRDVDSLDRDIFSYASYLVLALTIDAIGEADARQIRELYKVIDVSFILASDFMAIGIISIMNELDRRHTGTLIEVKKLSEALERKRTSTVRAPPVSLFFEMLTRPYLCRHVFDVAQRSAPSLEVFHDEFMARSEPLLLTECIDHWPAMTASRSWRDLMYISGGTMCLT
jgi:hypothetical protein